MIGAKYSVCWYGQIALLSIQLSELHSKVSEVACWFDWWSVDPDCSPQLAFLEHLEQRKTFFERHTHLQREFWNVPDHIKEEGYRKKRRTRYHVYEDDREFSWLDDDLFY